jgi:hypothetical protein
MDFSPPGRRRQYVQALARRHRDVTRLLDAQQKSDLRQVALACVDVRGDAQVKTRLQAIAKVAAGE